jgi:hypothetical protein
MTAMLAGLYPAMGEVGRRLNGLALSRAASLPPCRDCYVMGRDKFGWVPNARRLAVSRLSTETRAIGAAVAAHGTARVLDDAGQGAWHWTRAPGLRCRT